MNSRVLNLYLNLDADADKPLARGLDNEELLDLLTLIQGDTFKLRIWPRSATGIVTAPLATVQLTGGTMVFAGKKSDDLGATELLYSASSFSEHNTELDDSGDWYYEATLDLNTTELEDLFDALPAAQNSIATLNDIEVRNGGNTERKTYQFPATILRQVYANESSPTPGTPAYPAPADIVTIGEVFSADIPTGQDYVDIDISGASLGAAPTRVYLLGVQLPGAGSAPIGLIAAHATSATSVRAWLTGQATVTGYKARVLVRA